ncbi:hypothetical protein [Actinomadura chokoriensis]|uniref:hypothetical protein n=1 Tax=Actinomadura chokoriensis TaxID=454156 RepID=UPI0031F7F69C
MTTAEITRPENGDRLREDRDFEVEGSVRNLGKEDLRLFIYAEKRSTFYLADYRAEDVHDGRWSIRSTGIGREFGREGDSHLVLAVTADGACRQRLSGLDTGDDHYPSFSALPRGCKVRAQIRVIEE